MTRTPAIFFGHGNPLNALQQNAWTECWRSIGESLAQPKAIVCVSAHWYVPETAVTSMSRPRTIHDFGGFPRELYEVQYPAPGDPQIADRVAELLAPTRVVRDNQWGLDHGTWSVLCHVLPKADVPVIQLSIDETQPARFHYDLAKRLAPLRDEGILIMGSGNLVHNLHTYAWGRHPVEPFDWNLRFEKQARDLMLSGDHDPLIEYETLGRDAMLSVPTPEHYLPLLYVIALQEHSEPVSFPVSGVDGGSISMTTVRVG
ncbi:MAG TPA: 4,5-DOPA dioxygenase extradiol [Pyrinomonadaceae bacterium]|nr:4,5-DOPA dioxygenase extradiol [Pyrinomonadaceae bacterium]